MSKRIGTLVGAALAAGSLAALPGGERLASAAPLPAVGRQAVSPPLAPARPMLPATAASVAPATDADTALTVSVTQDSSGVVSATSLTCRPPSGYPYANEVCAQLARADGFIENIPATGDACPLIYDPVTVRATGFWRGEAREFEATFANRCVAIEQTGGYLFNI